MNDPKIEGWGFHESCNKVDAMILENGKLVKKSRHVSCFKKSIL